MNRDERSVAIAGLTFFMFGLMIFLRDGSFVVPFPLNEFAVLAVSFLFMIRHPKKGWIPYLFFISSLAGVLGNLVLWETALPLEELYDFMEYTVIDWSRLTHAVFLVAIMAIFLSAYKKWYLKTLVALGIVLYAYGLVVDSLNYMLLSFVILMVSSILKKVQKPFHLIWVLYFLLLGMKWITVNFA